MVTIESRNCRSASVGSGLRVDLDGRNFGRLILCSRNGGKISNDLQMLKRSVASSSVVVHFVRVRAVETL